MANSIAEVIAEQNAAQAQARAAAQQAAAAVITQSAADNAVTQAAQAATDNASGDGAADGGADKAKRNMTFKAVAVDDQGVIIGIGASTGIDNDDEAVQKAALLGLAYDFCASSTRTFLANHDEKAQVQADLVCSWPGAPVLKSGKVLEPGADIPDGDPIVAINIQKGAETHWFVGIRPHDEAILDAARKGELEGFSWGGYAQKVTA